MTTETTPKKTRVQLAWEKAEALAEQAKQAKLKAERLEAVARTKEAGTERANDKQRRILLGAYLMNQAKAQGWELKALHIGSKPLADYLTRDRDRALFGLPPLPLAAAAAAAPSEDQPAG